MLIRKIGKNGVATLKRTPSIEESAKFNISMFPTTAAALDIKSWTNVQKKRSAVKLKDIAADLGQKGSTIMHNIFEVKVNCNLVDYGQVFFNLPMNILYMCRPKIPVLYAKPTYQQNLHKH